jgi:hypothetical protein
MSSRRTFPYSLLAAATVVVALGGVGCGSGSSGNPDAGNQPTYNFPWDWVGIVGTGQSLSVGALGTPVQPGGMSQPYNNLKLQLGSSNSAPPFDPTASVLQVVPLTEPLRGPPPDYPSAYPRNIDGETPHTAMADQITAMAMAAAAHDYVSVHTVVGESGQPMTVIQKNPVNLPAVTGSQSVGRAYDATLFEASALTRLATANGKSYGIGGIVITHGEADAGNGSYANDLYTLLTNYNTDLLAITGQTAAIPMLVSQQDSVPSDSGSVSVSAVQQWLAGVQHPGEITCTGPKYQYSYAVDTAHVHMGPVEYEKLGEKYAQVYFERQVLGHDWQPLQPISVSVNATVITIQFHVPVPPLQWDTTLPPPHGTMIPEWAMGRGFEVTAASARQMITDVQIMGGDTVQITVANDLTGLRVVVGYAAIAEGGTPPTDQTARWGLLKDSDPFVGSVTNFAQPNWCVAFQVTAPYPS